MPYIVMIYIARIFIMLPRPIKLMEEGKKFICKVREIVYKYQYIVT